MRPALVALDFKELHARRYWPKPGGGFVTDEAALCAPEDQDATLPAVIEQFRLDGGRKRKVNVPMGPA